MADKFDPYELDRFIQAQTQDFEIALTEISSARKRSHWMWYIFPQFAGLGFSAISQRYAIRSAAEARAYLNHHILGARLIQCIEALLADFVNDCQSFSLSRVELPLGQFFVERLGIMCDSSIESRVP